jgi:hypothetical protein
MKKIFTLLPLLLLSVFTFSQAKYSLNESKKWNNQTELSVPKLSRTVVPKTTSCFDDVYAFINRTTLLGADYFWSTGTGIGQIFPYSGQGEFIGAQVFVASLNKYDADLTNGDSEIGLTLKLKVYDTDFTSGPNLLGEQAFSFDDNANDYAWVPFDSPVAISGDYIVVLVNEDARDIIPWMNTNGEGQGQGLALIFDNGFFGYTASLDDPATTTVVEADRDAMILPFIGHNVTADFSASSLTVNTGTPVDFTNTSIIDSLGFHNAYFYATTPATDLFVWDFNDGSSATSTNASHSFTNCGVYDVALTANYVNAYDSLVCSDTKIITITVQDDIVSSATTTESACSFGSGTAALDNPAGGTGPYSYTWSNNEITQTITNIEAGSYSVTITDINSCTATLSNIVVENLQPVTSETNTEICPSELPYVWNGLTFTQVASQTATLTSLLTGCDSLAALNLSLKPIPTGTTTSTPAGCGLADGTATAQASGTTVITGYNWNTTPSQSTQTAAGLSAGIYEVTITGNNNCAANLSVTVSNPNSPAVTVTPQDVLCFGETTGSAIASVTGGTTPYSYSWNNDPLNITIEAVDLAAGDYEITITDAANCVTVQSVTINQPVAPLDAYSFGQNVSCFGGANGYAEANVVGGTGNYYYNWSNGETTSFISGLVAGDYTVTIFDDNLCAVFATATITEPLESLSANATVTTNVLCFDASTGSAAVQAAGGTPIYSYSWNTTPAQNSATAQGLAAGNYTVTVLDANQCSTTAQITVTQPISAVTANASVTSNALCYGGNTGSTAVQAAGGTPNYTYSWNTTPAQTTATAQGLAAGNYTVTVSDVNQCSTSAQVTVTQPQSITISTVVSSGAVDATVTGGTSPYTYSWSNSATTQDISSVAVGSYTLTATDANGCSSSTTVQVATNSIEELNDAVIVSLYPNPASNEFKIVTSQENVNNTSFVIMSDDGKIVVAPRAITTTETAVNTDSFATGVYFIQFFNTKGTTVKKLIVRK